MTHRLATARQLAAARQLDRLALLHPSPLLQLIVAPDPTERRLVLRLILRHSQLEHGTLQECGISVVVSGGQRRSAHVTVSVGRVEADEAPSSLRERYLLLYQPVHGIGILGKQTDLTYAVCSEHQHTTN